MRAGGVGLGVGTANDQARKRDEELHLKGVRVEERIPHRLSSNPLLPTTQTLSTTLLTMTTFTLDNPSITCTDTRAHLLGVFGKGPYPEPAEVSTPTLIGD